MGFTEDYRSLWCLGLGFHVVAPSTPPLRDRFEQALRNPYILMC